MHGINWSTFDDVIQLSERPAAAQRHSSTSNGSIESQLANGMEENRKINQRSWLTLWLMCCVRGVDTFFSTLFERFRTCSVEKWYRWWRPSLSRGSLGALTIRRYYHVDATKETSTNIMPCELHESNVYGKYRLLFKPPSMCLYCDCFISLVALPLPLPLPLPCAYLFLDLFHIKRCGFFSMVLLLLLISVFVSIVDVQVLVILCFS